MEMPGFIKQLDQKLEGLPNGALTALLLAIAAVAIVTALFARPLVKASVAAWMLLP